VKSTADKHVKGDVFVQYVRMIRKRKDADWADHLTGGDMALLQERVRPDGWYPMEAFERMGNAILRVIAGGQLALVRQWGHSTAGPLAEIHSSLVAPGDPRETLMRFKVFRAAFFDFEAMRINILRDDYAQIELSFGMGDVAEQAACVQTAGFFVGLLERAGGANINVSFKQRRWEGGGPTLLDLRWSTTAGAR